MRDPFDTQTHLVHSSHPSSGEFVPQTTMAMLGDSGFWTPGSDSLVKHQLQRETGRRNVRDEDNNALMDPEFVELCARSRSQEEEIMLLRRQINDACAQELQLLKEKHLLERRLSDLRMALDEKQDDGISDALKNLTLRKGYIEENIRLAHDLQMLDIIHLKEVQRSGQYARHLKKKTTEVAEEEVYIFTSSLIGLLAEYNIRLPLLNASTIASSMKRLYQNMEWKIRSSDASLDQRKHLLGNRLGDVTSNIERQPPKFSSNQLSQPHLDSRAGDLRQYDPYPVDLPVESTPSQPRFIRNYDMMDMKGVRTAPVPDVHYMEFPPNTYKERGGNASPIFREDDSSDAIKRRETGDSQFYIPTPHERQASTGSEEEVSLPGIEGFQIIGEARPGNTLRACGYPTNGTSLCNFQWVRHLENGTRQSIEAATVPDYVVTADDVGTFLAVDCTPMDDSGRQGELVRLFANNQEKITCDPDMQHEIDSHISAGRASFTVFLLLDSLETWEQGVLFLKRTGYQIKVSSTDHVLLEEKYSPDLYIKVPNGQSTQFVLISSEGRSVPFTTSGTSQAYTTEDDIRFRDIIVLTLRYFQAKAVDGKRKGKA